MSHRNPSPSTVQRYRALLDRAFGIDALLTLALLAAIAILRLRAPIGDPDLGWHLAAGAHMLETGTLPRSDGFSYVATGHPWVVYSWLAEIFFAICRRAAGPLALVASAAALLVATFTIVVRTCRRSGARHTVAIFATACAATVSVPTWTVRPQLFSFVFLAIFQHLLRLDRERAPAGRLPAVPAPIWGLVPIACLWANIHIFFVFGFLLIGIEALARPREWLWNPTRKWPPPARLGLGILIVLVTLVNPYGWHLWRYIIEISAQKTTFAMVAELQSPSLHQLHGQLLTALFFATMLVLTISPARKHPADVAAVLVFAFLAYSMARNMALFAIVAAPVFARHVDAFLPRKPVPTAPLAPARRALHIAALGALGVVLTTGLHHAPAASPGDALSRHRYPVDAVEFLRAQPPLGRLFNHFNWGGYLIEHLYPLYRVSMDGRTAVYGDDTLRQYRATQFLEPGWRTFLDRCRPDIILWRKRDAFVRALELLPEWNRLYEDDVAVIFVRDERTPDPEDPVVSPKRYDRHQVVAAKQSEGR